MSYPFFLCMSYASSLPYTVNGKLKITPSPAFPSAGPGLFPQHIFSLSFVHVHLHSNEEHCFQSYAFQRDNRENGALESNLSKGRLRESRNGAYK